MNTLVILITLMIALFLLVPDSASAQAKRNNGVSASGLSVSMKKQIVSQMNKIDEHNPKWFKECIDEAGGLERVVDIQTLSLTRSSAQQYLLVGKNHCTFGARTPMYWIFENRKGKIRMLADIGAADDVKLTSRYTKGYRNIEVIVITRAGAEICTITYKFDGSLYRQTGNASCKPLKLTD